MEKKKYYISVQAGTILENEGDAAYEFVIEATERQISQLQELFDGKDTADHYAFGRAHIPFREYHNDLPNDAYDYYLKQVYGMLYECGTPETKQHIADMHILE